MLRGADAEVDGCQQQFPAGFVPSSANRAMLSMGW
jgi:hypothetical protein